MHQCPLIMLMVLTVVLGCGAEYLQRELALRVHFTPVVAYAATVELMVAGKRANHTQEG